MDVNDYYNKKKVKQLGFSDRLIAELLPEPILTGNPHHKDGKPMKLWKKDIVKQAMLNKKFKEYQDERQRRSLSMQNNSAKKRLETRQLMIEALKELRVKIISIEKIDRENIERTRKIYGNESAKKISKKALRKMAIDYIRHKCTNYDEIYRNLVGKVGRQDSYFFMKEELLKIIARHYPMLEEEACRQILYIRTHQEQITERYKLNHEKYQRWKELKKRRKQNTCNNQANI